MNYAKIESKLIVIIKRAVNYALKKEYSITQKGNEENIVTSSDFLIQEFLIKNLKKLLPESGFLCEENNFLDFNHEFVWVIDPIDGTTNFSRKIKNCAVSVALLNKQKPIIGVVYNIFNRELFSARQGCGAKLNGKTIKVSDNPFKNSILCTAMSLYNKEYAPICSDIINDAYLKCNDIRRFGSCALELCYIAAGMCDLYFEIRVFPWDYAAGMLILQEAGGILTGLNYEKPNYAKPTALIGANSSENYNILNSIINKYLKILPYEENL